MGNRGESWSSECERFAQTDTLTLQTQDKYLIAMLSPFFNRADENRLDSHRAVGGAHALTTEQWTGACAHDFGSFFQASLSVWFE